MTAQRTVLAVDVLGGSLSISVVENDGYVIVELDTVPDQEVRHSPSGEAGIRVYVNDELVHDGDAQ